MDKNTEEKSNIRKKWDLVVSPARKVISKIKYFLMNNYITLKFFQLIGKYKMDQMNSECSFASVCKKIVPATMSLKSLVSIPKSIYCIIKKSVSNIIKSDK